eukprot:CAMPEP_0203665918 /NCGR_PEP_ID=MMETSP0090-20130426/3047_1 /ASSEMBLY_ACC=CAM_ASM_001088 /TAXON_ID=426623 /ORGANISM="Chaetoceros affinis, Strain CCMP159" /LENGTH=599 /DNA_ID=CAMNT_0050529639 /DNA_START=65 /DNA_END=1860 /DNA_ORIENTATION=-
MDTPGLFGETVTETKHFSCDLVKESKSHVAFLQTLHLNGISIEKPTFETFRRYSELWLPLVNNHHQFISSSNNLEGDKQELPAGIIPPGDIAWLWHCHRLAPYRYAKYVKETFTPSSSVKASGDDFFVLDPKYPFVLQLEDNTTNATFDKSKHGDAARYTVRLWEELYPNEPFFVAQNQENSNNQDHKVDDEVKVGVEESQSKLLSGFDVIESCERQKAFLWQVSQTNFNDDEFLAQGVENYYKFVSLMKKGEDKPRFLVPTYQIDLMWHTHILHSIQMYHADCRNIISSILEHDDSLTDRSEGGVLDSNFHATKNLWYNVYNTEYRVAGGMYRGEPPKDFFHGEWVFQQVVEQSQYHLKQDILPEGVTFAHLIGNVGASSVGTEFNESKLSWKSIDSADAFLPANPKSTTRGVNANEFKQDYVFGNGVKGVGYYHLHTRESYDIILARIQAKQKKLNSDASCAICCIFLIVCAPCGLAMLQNKKEEIAYYADLTKLINLRKNAAGPSIEIPVPAEVVGRVKHYDSRNNRMRRNHNKNHDSSTNNYYTDGGYFMYGAGCGYSGVYTDMGGGGVGGEEEGGGGGGGCGAAACGGGYNGDG